MQDLNLNNNDSIISLLRKFIINQIIKERELTQNKINLFLKCSMEQIFKIFISNNDYISSGDIKQIFNMLNENEIEKIIEIYDKDKDYHLNYNEFYNFIFPKYIDININEIREKNQKNSNSSVIDNETISLLYNIFQIEIINLIASAEIIKKIISNIDNSTNINIYLYLFELLKGKDKNYDYLNEFIECKDIINFLNINSNGIEIYEQDITNFIYRYDYSNNSKLNIEEFTNMVNYFLNYENENGLNNKTNFENKNKLFLNESLLEKNKSKNLSTKYANNNNSIKNEISLSKKLKDSENILINNNKGYNSINSAINFKEKELIYYQFYSYIKSCLIECNYFFSRFLLEKIFSNIVRNLKIKLLAEYFQNIIKELNELEQKKKEFSEKINSKELISLFDIRKELNINIDDFISVFTDYFKIQFSKEDFLHLIKKYDINKDGKLNYDEFNYMITPLSKNNLKRNKKNIMHNLENIIIYNVEQKNLISNLFINLIKCEKSIEIQRKKLHDIPLFTCYEMFEIIRNKENKLLNSEDIFYFLKNQNIIIKNEEFDLLLNYLFFLYN